jgi:Zn-dependent metalloprotease
MRLSKRALIVGATFTISGVVAAWTVAATAAAPVGPSANSPAVALQMAKDNTASLVASKPGYLHASAEDKFFQGNPITSAGFNYVPYERTYKDLKVVGGDFVLVTNNAGQVIANSVAQEQAIGNVSISPKLSSGEAEAVAKGGFKSVDQVESTQLVVYALGNGGARLAWESTIRGTGNEGYSRQTVDVDAQTGKVLRSQEHVVNGTGNSGYNGSAVSLRTRTGGSGFLLSDSATNNMPCQNATGNVTFTGTDDLWGNGNATNRETGCVDALFGAERQKDMLSSWLGRNGMDGAGGAWPIRVGLNDLNAFYDGTQVQVGHNQAGQWIGSIDVIAHELGHGIDDHTPGGISGSGTQEFVADTFGAATEWFVNGVDTPDFLVGETINLVGSGPIRNMFNPSALGDPNCYSSSIPSTEVHAAAGPGNHWFYLVSQGNNPPGGPTSPICAGGPSSVTGVGIQNAIKIMYNAMLMKTSGSSYLRYRVWTLQAAKNLDATCGLFNTVKNAWNAVSVPAQTGEATCTGGTTPPPTTTAPPPTTPPGGCSGNKLGNPGFESGSAPWTATAGVIGAFAGQSPHSGTRFAWMDGYGTTHTDTLSQTVTIPAGCTATLTFWLHIDTAETTTTTQFDRLTVQMGTTTVATFSNLNKAAGYQLRTFNVSAFAGQTVTLKFTGTEDSSLQTSFVVDDTAITLS